MQDYLVHATAWGGRVRAVSVNGSATVGELGARHGTDPAVTAALGRLALGGLLLGALLKREEHRVTLRVRGDGPAGTLLVTANGSGEVRGLVGNPRPDVEQVRDGKLNVSGAVGRNGQLSVTRDLGLRQPYSSTVELVSGEISEDLAFYLARSEQVPSAVGVGVFVRNDGSVEAAGGYMVQLLAGLREDEIAEIEAAIAGLPHPTTMLREGTTPEDMLRRIFPSGFELLERREVRFHCPCTRERAERALTLLGLEALEEIQSEHSERGITELTCEFCTERYTFSHEDLEALVEAAR